VAEGLQAIRDGATVRTKPMAPPNAPQPVATTGEKK
jgi:hypothetical protein